MFKAIEGVANAFCMVLFHVRKKETRVIIADYCSKKMNNNLETVTDNN